MLDGALRDEIDDRNGAGLVLAPGTGNALFELGRIPRQIAIDDHAGVLKVQPGRARVRAEEHTQWALLLNALISARRRCCGTEPVCHAKPSFRRRHNSRTSSSIRSHSEKHDHLHASFSRHSSRTFSNRRASDNRGLRIEDVSRVANHAHHGEVHHKALLLLLRERTAFGDGGETRNDLVVLVIDLLLLGCELYEMLTVGAVGQLGFHVAFAAAQHVRRDALVQPGEVAITARPPRSSNW